jgi:hypothetical protein
MRVQVDGAGIITAASETLTPPYITFPTNRPPDQLIGLVVTGTSPNRLLNDGDDIIAIEVNEATSPFTPTPAYDTGAVRKGDLVISITDNGARPDGTDATTGIRAALTAANALSRAGVASTLRHPGATVIIPPGVYSLTSLAAPLDITCNVISTGATFLVPAAYAGTVLRVGHPTTGSLLQGAQISLPDVVKPTSSAHVAGSIGITVQNLYSSTLTLGRTAYFETGLNFTGLGEGTVYNQIFIGWVGYCKVAVQLKPSTGGWVNQNTFVGGGIQQSAGYAGGLRITGWRHLVLDGNNINSVNGNTFVGVSLEGDVSQYAIYLHHAYQNNWFGCRHEAGTQLKAVTVSGATLTATAHGLAVGDMVIPTATVLPTGMAGNTPYYVIATPDADTYTIALKKGGTAITFGTSGTAVLYGRPHRVYVDTSGPGTSENVIQKAVNPLQWLDIVHSTAVASGNVQETSAYRTSDSYLVEDLPQMRARNAYSAAPKRTLFAAYPPATSPTEDPGGWTAALSDRGMLFADGTNELGRLFSVGGVLCYRKPADGQNYEIPSATRSGGATSVSALSCAANTTTLGASFTVTGAATSDYVLATSTTALPAGIVIANAYVSGANTVPVVFGNLTASPISVTCGLHAIAFRQYY